MMNRYRSAEVVIVGAGLAGAAAAFFLTQRGVRDLVILEKESVPGVHASGRNAAMVRQVVPDSEVVFSGAHEVELMEAYRFRMGRFKL